MRKNYYGIAGIVFFITVCLANATSSFQKSFPAIISFDIQQDINISLSNLALLSSFTFFAYGLAQIPIGVLTDKLGGKKILGALQILCGIFTLFFAFSSSSFVSLSSRLVIGFLITATVPGLKIIATCYPSVYFSRLSSFLLAAGTFGALIAATPLVYIKNIIGWRYSIAFIAILTIICGLVILFSPIQEQKSKQNIKSNSMLQNIKMLAQNKEFIPIFLWFAFIPGTLFTFGGYWLGPYLIQGAKMTQVHTSNLIFLSAIFSTVCLPLFPIISEKIVKSHKKTMQFCTLLYLFLLIPYVFFRELNYTFLMIIYTTLCTLATGLIPIGFALCKEIVNENCFGTASGALNMAGPIFASLFQVVFAYILTNLPNNGEIGIEQYAYTFIFLVILASCGFISSLFIQNSKKNKAFLSK